MLVIDTQYMENYGTAEEPYWKFKGGSSYKITDVPGNIDYEEVVSMVRTQIEHDEPMSREYILGWRVESHDWLSDFEKSQLEYEGKIAYPEPVIEYSDLNESFA
jgi:hypothetical protein